MRICGAYVKRRAMSVFGIISSVVKCATNAERCQATHYGVTDVSLAVAEAGDPEVEHG
jgi:hypothetical protein